MPTINEMIDFCEDMAAYDCFSNEQFARREMFYAISDELKELREKKIPGKWVKEWEDIPITGGIMHQPYWSCPRCGRKWEAYSAQFITFCSKCGMKLIDGDCKEGDENG